MIAVDTNVSVRLPTGDEPKQEAAARSLFAAEPIRIAKTVFLETGWVLRSLYGAAHERLTQFAPVLLIQLYFVFLRSGFDAFPGGVAFRVGHPLHLLEAGDCVAHVRGVMDGFFTFPGESEVLIGDMIAASFSDLGHAS
jgi:hypothetical protein